jgi:hypothetical protein
VVDERWPLGVRVVGLEDVAGEGGSFERDREWCCGRVQQPGGGRERFADTLAEERDLGIMQALRDLLPVLVPRGLVPIGNLS